MTIYGQTTYDLLKTKYHFSFMCWTANPSNFTNKRLKFHNSIDKSMVTFFSVWGSVSTQPDMGNICSELLINWEILNYLKFFLLIRTLDAKSLSLFSDVCKVDLSQKTNDIGSVFEAAPANLSIAPSHHDKAITSINISVTHSQVSEACSVSRFNTGSVGIVKYWVPT